MRFAYKLVIFQFILIYALQAFAMLSADQIFLIVTNVYDGLFSGGLIIIFAELSAEIAYPVGESISLGFINALQLLIRFAIRFTVDILTFTEIYDPEQRERKRKQDNLIWVYFIIMAIFLVFTLLSIFLIMKAPLILRRSLADACLEIPYDEDEWKKKPKNPIEQGLLEGK